MKLTKFISSAILGFILSINIIAEDRNIVEVAVADDNFNTLATALTEAGLIEALESEGPFTVFAPTDAAFANLPEGTLENLLEDKDALTEILLYHVVKGKVMASDVVKYKEAATLSGKMLNINIKDNGVMLNDSKVVNTDIEASNGVIHVIDTVLLPPTADEAKESNSTY